MAGAVVTIVPGTGSTVRLTTNSVGNFYTSAPLSPPLTISVSFGGYTNTMSGPASTSETAAPVTPDPKSWQHTPGELGFPHLSPRIERRGAKAAGWAGGIR